jgi:hypothetical protein
VWVLLAYLGESPLATPDQMLYLRIKLISTNKIVVREIDYGDPILCTITDPIKIRKIVNSLVIHRMTPYIGGGPAVRKVIFYSKTGIYEILLCGEPDRLRYKNPWNLEADIPPHFFDRSYNE